jgi:hypothetical protein
MADDLFRIGLLLGMAFFVMLCLIRATRYIKSLDDRRERLVALLLALLVFSATLTVSGSLFELGWLRILGRASMMVSIWVLNFYIVNYWRLVARGETE